MNNIASTTNSAVNRDAVIKANTPKSEMNMETFLMLLTVQLSNQNPLEPMNDRDFFAQMAQLGQVQGMDNIQGTLDFGQAANLIGKNVTAVRPGDLSGKATVEGEVTKVAIKNGEQIISVKEADGGIVEIPMEAIQTISK
jgi:flagellar basal-body rod modification protein FlgD